MERRSRNSYCQAFQTIDERQLQYYYSGYSHGYPCRPSDVRGPIPMHDQIRGESQLRLRTPVFLRTIAETGSLIKQ